MKTVKKELHCQICGDKFTMTGLEPDECCCSGVCEECSSRIVELIYHPAEFREKTNDQTN